MPDELQPGLAAGGDVALDELAVGDDEQHAADTDAVLADAVVEDPVVEHGLVEGDRQGLLRPEANGVGQLLRVVDPGDLEGADADPVVRDPEAHAVARQLVLAEEGLQHRGELLRLAQLAADDDAALERHARHPDDLRAALVDHLRGGDLGSAELEPDELVAVLRALLGARSPPGARGGTASPARRERARPAARRHRRTRRPRAPAGRSRRRPRLRPRRPGVRPRPARRRAPQARPAGRTGSRPGRPAASARPSASRAGGPGRPRARARKSGVPARRAAGRARPRRAGQARGRSAPRAARQGERRESARAPAPLPRRARAWPRPPSSACDRIRSPSSRPTSSPPLRAAGALRPRKPRASPSGRS